MAGDNDRRSVAGRMGWRAGWWASAVLLTLGLAACSSGGGAAGGTTASGSAGSSGSSSSTAAPSGGGSGAGCSVLKPADLAAVVKVPLGKPYNAEGGAAAACEYGIGKNAGLTGQAIMTAEDDTMLVSYIPIQGQQQYETSVSIAGVAGGTTTDLSGVGDKASYDANAVPPNLYAVKGQAYCEVQVTVSSVSELGLSGSGDLDTSPSDAATVARREGELCNDFFNS